MNQLYFKELAKGLVTYINTPEGISKHTGVIHSYHVGCENSVGEITCLFFSPRLLIRQCHKLRFVIKRVDNCG